MGAVGLDKEGLQWRQREVHGCKGNITSELCMIECGKVKEK